MCDTKKGKQQRKKERQTPYTVCTVGPKIVLTHALLTQENQEHI